MMIGEKGTFLSADNSILCAQNKDMPFNDGIWTGM